MGVIGLQINRNRVAIDNLTMRIALVETVQWRAANPLTATSRSTNVVNFNHDGIHWEIGNPNSYEEHDSYRALQDFRKKRINAELKDLEARGHRATTYLRYPPNTNYTVLESEPR